jgi:hypothetical protein
MWDDYYGPHSPGEILAACKSHVLEAKRSRVEDYPPELERELTALRALRRTVERFLKEQDEA